MTISYLNKKSVLVLLSLLVALQLGCKSTEAQISDEDKKGLDQVKRLLDSGTFEIDMKAVYPFNSAATTKVLNAVLVGQTGNNASRINLSGENYILEFRNDSVMGKLPYYGEQRMSSGHYNAGSGGINLKGLMDDQELVYDKKKKHYQLEFRIRENEHQPESYRVLLQIHPNQLTNVTINSSHRDVIRYDGTLSKVEIDN